MTEHTEFMGSGLDLSVILSTYNSPRWLELVLEGYFCQSFLGSFEIVIADDGSTEETAQLIKKISARSPVPIRHVWQPDEGFQKCRILNKAIAVSRGRLLVFSDGDCIPQPNMLQIHSERSRVGIFLTGGYLKLPKDLSLGIGISEIQSGTCFLPGWLFRRGYKRILKLVKLMIPRPFDRIANLITPTKRTWNGHNSSCYRGYAIAVNGFNEWMQYGGEDVEFGIRLNNLGVRGKHLRFSTVPLHLYHRHDYVKSSMIEDNKKVIRSTIDRRLVTLEHGVSDWIEKDFLRQA